MILKMHRNLLPLLCGKARTAWYISVRQLTSMRTGRYRAVPLKSAIGGRLKEKSTVGGRLKKKSTVGGRLRKKKGRGRRKKKEEERRGKVPRPRALAACGRFSPRAPSPPVGHSRASPPSSPTARE
ncbi:hypothetical protein B296_00040492 [Ensete ventricosum]|uniref:Uncharacterized protein n=1 Tax=Ensete ventricosum TaxID=4639 RepID=A0A426YSF3_ENSVE|nr:hypothetical protein B296_00040492 [Ensete ventricosum]